MCAYTRDICITLECPLGDVLRTKVGKKDHEFQVAEKAVKCKCSNFRWNVSVEYLLLGGGLIKKSKKVQEEVFKWMCVSVGCLWRRLEKISKRDYIVYIKI